MATIQQRRSSDGSVSWRVQIRLKGFPHQNATFSRKTDARRWAESVQTEIRAGRYFPTADGRRQALSDLLSRYREEIQPCYEPVHRARREAKLLWWEQRLGAFFPGRHHASAHRGVPGNPGPRGWYGEEPKVVAWQQSWGAR